MNWVNVPIAGIGIPIWLSLHTRTSCTSAANKLGVHLTLGKIFKSDLARSHGNGGKKRRRGLRNITTIHESPMKIGMIYCGTDDGNVWLTKTGGEEWKKYFCPIQKQIHSGQSRVGVKNL